MTIEFHRSVIANDSYLEKYRDQQQKRNDIVDCIMLQTGNMTDERSEYSLYYREQAKSKEAFRYYSQNILATDNQAISAQYYGFFPYILYIPKDRSYQFMLPRYTLSVMTSLLLSFCLQVLRWHCFLPKRPIR